MKTTVLLPGGFKPPHGGHLQLANAYAKNPEVDKVIVMIGPAERDGITREQSMAVWKMLPTDKKVEVLSVSAENPMVAAFDYVLNMSKDAKGQFAMAASSKGDDAKRSDLFVKSIEAYKTKPTKDGRNAPQGVTPVKLPIDVTPLNYKGRSDEYEGKGVSASVLRKDLANSDKNQFATNYPGIDKSTVSKIYDILSKKKKPIFEIIEERAVLSTLIRTLLAEGGAAGHMAHPFDIPSVKTGKDLESVFVKTADFLTKNPVPVKIDGINASIRLGDIKGKRQFVIDRGSNKPLDVQGVSKNDLTNRFGEGHGMIKIGGKVLDIFNKALPSITPELKALGMIDNPNIMLNIEYVEGQSNVQKYDNNFLAIHNLLELVRVSPTKRATQEVSYDKKALQGLIQKVGQVAKKEGFQVMGEIPAKMESKPNFSSALSKSYTVIPSEGKKETKSLQQWLAKAKNTKGEKLKLKDGKTVDALSKQVFIWIKDGKPVSELIQDPKDTQKAIDSYVIYMATMTLGDVILESLSSPIGEVKDQEGIVVRDKEVYSQPYKITGSFILRGMQSSFQK
jgi:hypothetical protein